jgi:hypothetical protein
LNDSLWAHQVTTSTQDAACGYKNPAIPGEFTQEQAERGEILTPTPPSVEVKPDGAKYLIRWISAKPVQAAVQRLIAINENWATYGQKFERNDPTEKPTDVSQGYYNRNDMITILVILEKPGPGGASFLDYAFQDSGRVYGVKGDLHFVCAGLRTSNGVVFARLGGPMGDPPHHSAITISFPGQIGGKPLITKPEEEVEFRLVGMQRVFETTFTINAKDLPDGSQAGLYIPTAVTDLKEYSNSLTTTNQ